VGGVAVCVVGTALILTGFGVSTYSILKTDGWPLNTDIAVYLHAANAVASDVSPYSQAPGLDPYPYPPLFAEFIGVLTKVVGTGKGMLLWALSGLVLLVASIMLMARAFSPKLPIGLVLLLGGIFTMSHIARTETLHGQVNFLMAFLVVAGAVLWQRDRSMAAAFLWALAIVTKPFLGLLVLFLLRKKDFKGAFATLAFSAALFVGSFVFAFSDPLQIFQDWRTSTHWHTGLPNVAKPDNQTFYGFFNRLFVDTKYSTPIMNYPAAPVILMIPVVALAFYVFFQSVQDQKYPGDRGGPRTLLEVAITLALFMACGPFMEGDHIFVLLPGLFGAMLLFSATYDRRWLIASALWLLAFANLFLPYGLNQFRPPYWPKLEGVMILRSLHYGLIFFVAAAWSGFMLRSDRLKDRAFARIGTPGRTQDIPAQASA
jgi:hypothetical protein